MVIHRSLRLSGLVAGVLLFLVAIPARADFTNLMETGGGAMVMSTGETTVRMASEVVEIILGDSNYTVRATFEFVNDGPTVTLPVGFPRERYGMNSRLAGAPDFISFTGSVDGKPVTFTERTGPLKIRTYRDRSETEFTITDATRIEHILSELHSGNQRVDLGMEYSSFSLWETRWYVKDMTFKARGATIVTAEYSDEYTVGPTTRYIYGTGRAWKGPIGKATFVVTASPAVWAIDRARFISPESRETRSYRLERVDEFTHQYILTDLEPAEDEEMDVFIGPPKQPWGRSIAYNANEVLNKELPADFPAILPYKKLHLMRQLILANRGQKLDNPGIMALFFLTGTEVVPSELYGGTGLTAIDKKNIAILDAALAQIKTDTAPRLTDPKMFIDELASFFIQLKSPLDSIQIDRIMQSYGAGGLHEMRQICSVLTAAQKKAMIDRIDRRLSYGNVILNDDQRRLLIDYGPESTTPWAAILTDDQLIRLYFGWDTLDEATRAKVRNTF